MAEAVLDFPFVQDLPKREVKKVRSNWDEFKEMAKVTQEVGQLVPQHLAAELLGVSRQRIATLMQGERFRTFTFFGRDFVCEVDIVSYAEAERKSGRPCKVPVTKKEAWQAAVRASRK